MQESRKSSCIPPVLEEPASPKTWCGMCLQPEMTHDLTQLLFPSAFVGSCKDEQKEETELWEQMVADNLPGSWFISRGFLSIIQTPWVFVSWLSL